MKFKDYYQTLGVPRDATQEDIKKAYRRLARKYHPDVSKEAHAETHFKEVGEAYEVLKDPEKRSAYDQFGNQWKAGQDFRPPPNWDKGFEFRGGGFTNAGDFSDFFESLFGRSDPWRGTQRESGFSMRGEDHDTKIAVSLEESYRGATRTITLRSPKIDGSGQVTTSTRNLNVRIPKGVIEGQRIRLSGQGSPGRGRGTSGDLYLEIIFEPHHLYRADGRDIYLDLPVTPWEAGLGGRITVPTLGGKVDLKIPSGAQSGQKLRLRGKGLPGKPSGDLYVVLKIVTPKPKTASDRELYEKMAREMPMNPRTDMGV
jgi:curved DNA-binding protein